MASKIEASEKRVKDLIRLVARLEGEVTRLRGERKSERFYTPEEFVKEFNVGDLVSGWPTKKVLKITAIGERRFLAKDLFRNQESVNTMESRPWSKVKVSNGKT